MYEMEGLTRSGCTTSPIARIRVRCLTAAGLVHAPHKPGFPASERRPEISPERFGISPGPARRWRQTDFYRLATQRGKGCAASSGLIVRRPPLPTGQSGFSTGGTGISPSTSMVFHCSSPLLWTTTRMDKRKRTGGPVRGPRFTPDCLCAESGLRPRGGSRRGARRSYDGLHEDVQGPESPGPR
jgi:hypothetical protein